MHNPPNISSVSGIRDRKFTRFSGQYFRGWEENCVDLGDSGGTVREYERSVVKSTSRLRYVCKLPFSFSISFHKIFGV